MPQAFSSRELLSFSLGREELCTASCGVGLRQRKGILYVGSVRIRDEEMGCAYQDAAQASRRMLDTLFPIPLKTKQQIFFSFSVSPPVGANFGNRSDNGAVPRRATAGRKRGSPCCVGGSPLPVSQHDLAGMAISFCNEKLGVDLRE